MEQKSKEARRQWRRLLAAEQTCPPPLFKSGRVPILFFLRSPKNRALASAYSPFGSGSGGLRESNDRRSGEMAPRSAETSFQTSFSSPSSASFAPFFFLLRESQRHSSFAKISRRRLRGWAFQFRAASSRLGCRNVFTRIRRRRRRCYACARHFLLNGEMWCWFRNRLSRFLF